MLWFGIASLGMSFAGLTSAYVVSKERADWLENLQIPQAFWISLGVILVSSVTMYLAKRSVLQESHKKATLWLWVTFLLGVLFIFLQYKGFSEIYNEFGYSFTGPTSTISYSYIFLIVMVHILHVIAALISLIVVIYNHYKQKYHQGNTLGIELAATFWHFVDFLWIYLFLFFYFVR